MRARVRVYTCGFEIKSHRMSLMNNTDRPAAYLVIVHHALDENTRMLHERHNNASHPYGLPHTDCMSPSPSASHSLIRAAYVGWHSNPTSGLSPFSSRGYISKLTLVFGIKPSRSPIKCGLEQYFIISPHFYVVNSPTTHTRGRIYGYIWLNGGFSNKRTN